MRIALIAPPWYPIPPGGYGGIEWVVALLADGLTDRGHEVTLFAAPGSDTRAKLVSPLDEEPPRDAIGDPWYEASHVVSVYEHGDEFEILHDHTGPVGVSVGALSDRPTVHTLHGPFTDQTTMLYRRIARRHWFVAISESQRSMAPENLRWAGVVYNGIPMDRYPFHRDKDDFLLFLGRADEEKAPDLAIEAARRAGRRLVLCATTKNQTSASRPIGPRRSSRSSVTTSRSAARPPTRRRPSCWRGRPPCCSRSSGPSPSGW